MSNLSTLSCKCLQQNTGTIYGDLLYVNGLLRQAVLRYSGCNLTVLCPKMGLWDPLAMMPDCNCDCCDPYNYGTGGIDSHHPQAKTSINIVIL